VKCYEVTRCGDKERETCYVWNNLRSNPTDFENIQCWVLKNVFQQEDQELIKKCLSCKYYVMMKKGKELVTDYDAELALIACEGTINEDKMLAIGEVWERLKKNNKTKVILNLAKVTNIYSAGLGIIVKIHKEAQDRGGKLVVAGAGGYVQVTFESTRVARLLALAPDVAAAREIFEEIRKKQEAEVQAVKAPPPLPPKQRPPCWEFHHNHNPRNATLCDECFRKINPSKDPCWIVEGNIEGVSFQYVNEDCESCDYYREFGAAA
jgi:anti-sigma B factor antagonist